MTPLSDLIARVEGLEWPDREVDADLFRRFDKPPKVGKTDASGRPMNYLDWRYEGRGVWARSEFSQPAPDVRIAAPAYTASLDAALALVAWVLPAADWRVWADHHRGLYGCDFYHGPQKIEVQRKASPALAILSALLKALAAKEPS